MKLVEPPSCSPPSNIVFIGRNSRGQWVAQEQHGLYGGLFVNRAQAVKYALFENGHHPETIVELSLEIELDMRGNSPTISKCHAALICPTSENPSRPKTCPDVAIKIFRFVFTPNQWLHGVIPPHRRGVRVVTNVEAGCGGRERGSRRLARARTAKPCGPGAPTLALSERNDPLMTGARKPGPRGELGVSR